MAVIHISTIKLFNNIAAIFERKLNGNDKTRRLAPYSALNRAGEKTQKQGCAGAAESRSRAPESTYIIYIVYRLFLSERLNPLKSSSSFAISMGFKR